MTTRYGRDGDPVHVDFRKWPDQLHWQFTMRRLGEDEHGLWVWAPAGTPATRGHEPPIEFKSTAVKLLTPDRWWTAIWNSGDVTHELYVDIATPIEWNDNQATMIDLDLDVTKIRTTGEVRVLDEDEFEEHQVKYGYPPHIVDKARTTTARIALDLERGREPFGSVASQWLQQALEFE